MGNYDSPLNRGSAELQFEKNPLEVPVPIGLFGMRISVETDATENSEEGTEPTQ
jgi:hypothetical protein